MRLSWDIKVRDDSQAFLDKLVIKFHAIMLGMETNAKRLAAVDKGDMRKNINLEKISDFHYVLYSPMFYSAAVEFGTSPHIIRPKVAQALAFKVGRKLVFAKVVHHPGTNAQPFFRPAFNIAVEQIKHILD